QIDEYAVLVDGIMSVDSIVEMGHDLSTIVTEDSIRYLGQEVPISVTIGIAEGRPDKKLSAVQARAYNIVARADMAFKKARIMKKNFLVYDESMQISREFEENICWTKKIRKAIKSDSVIPYFQPIIDNTTGCIKKYECLIRMRDESGIILYPGAFLNTAKRSRLYPMLTRIMIEKVFETFHGRDMEFSINISVDDILSPDTTHYIYDILTIYRKIAHRAVFEIVESEGIENYEEVRSFISQVKSFGCKIAIDDFGTGYSNFDYIMKLDVDFLKIDASIIKNLPEDPNARIITETIVAFCKKMGIQTVAEFVHSREVYDIVREMGIDYSQGFFLGEPAETIALN
ncbi:MAG: EAL domain-containing protein, partial [Spirochaetota bacterium]